MAGGGEVGVTPMLGTILVLGVSVAGTATALLFGAPVLERLQEQSALDAMVGQLGALHEAQAAMAIPGDGRSVEVAMPRGQLRLEAGASWLVTVSQDASALHDDCHFQVLDWPDGDAGLLWPSTLGTECRTPAVDIGDDSSLLPGPDCATGDSGATINVPSVGQVTLPALACLEAHRLPDLATNLATAGDPCIPVPGVVATCPTGVTLSVPVGAGEDWHFALSNGESGASRVVYAEAWLLRSDRLQWDGGRVSAGFESGAVLAHGRSGDRVAWPPRLDPGDTAAGPSLLVLPTLRNVEGGESSGSQARAVTLTLTGSTVRHHGVAYRVQVDLAGGSATSLCQALRDASRDAPVAWTPDGPGGDCGTTGQLATTPAAEDDTVTVAFDPPNDAAGGPPAFVLTQMAYDVALSA